ncbi:MAG: hypothetical protein U1E63_00900 [Burkholderiales bacterium]
MARKKIALVGAGQIGGTLALILGAGGVKKVVEIELNAEERAIFDHSVNAVKELVEVTKRLMAA